MMAVLVQRQGSRLGFNVCVVPLSVKLGVLEFYGGWSWIGVGLELGSVKID